MKFQVDVLWDDQMRSGAGSSHGRRWSHLFKLIIYDEINFNDSSMGLTHGLTHGPLASEREKFSLHSSVTI